MYLFPAIDLRDGKVVRLAQGDYGRQTTYGDAPLEVARRFEAAGCTWLHVVDLDGARGGQMKHVEQIEAICRETKLKVEVGGGVRSEGAIDRLLRAGVFRCVVGTKALREWDWFEALMGNPTYRGRLVLGLDARDGKVAVDGWEKSTGQSAYAIAKKVTHWPLAAIVYTDIATDGMMTGPNLDALRKMCESTDVPIVASGGVGTLDDLKALRELPVQGVIVGRALYEGRFTIDEAVATLEKGA